MFDAIYIGNTQQISKKTMDVIYPKSYFFSKMDKNMTHLLPIPNITLNQLCHAYTYVSE